MRESSVSATSAEGVRCSTCGARVGVSNDFCGKCGTRVGEGATERRKPREAFVPALKTPEGAAQYKALVEAKRSFALKRRAALGILSMLCLLSAGFGDSGALALGSVNASVFLSFGLLVAMVAFWNSPIRQREYQAIAGAVDSEGKHRCLSCGHRGIFRKGQYRSDVVRAQCSQCGFHLWVESK